MRSMTFETLLARNGEKYMNIRTERGDFRLNSNYRPGDEAKRFAQGVSIPARGAILLMFGMGSGYHLRALLERLPEDGIVLLYEPSGELYDYAVNEYALQQLLADRRVFLLLGGRNERDIFALLDERIHWSNAAKQVFVVHPAYDRLFPEQLAFFEETIRNNNIRIYTNRNTEMHFGEAIAENTVHNLKYVPGASTMQELKGRFPKALPAILVSAGPSLDKNADRLRDAKGHAFIIAVDTALRTLKRHHIVPDATVTLDPLIPERYFEETDFADVPVFAKIQANYKILERHRADKIWFDSHEYLKRFLKSIGRAADDYHAGPSVATAAFSICAALGFQRIILVGQDLAYLGETTHAGGEKMAIQAEEENISYVEGVDGSMVKTRHDWLQYLRWFERVVREVEGEIEVIDATEGGARIHGTKLMTLEQAVKTCCVSEECDVTGLLKDNRRTLTAKERQRFHDYLAQGCSELAEMIGLIENMEVSGGSEAGETVSERTGEAEPVRLAEINHKLQGMQTYVLVDDATKKVSIPAITKLLEDEERAQEAADENAVKQAVCRARVECYRTIQSAWKEAAERLLPVLQLAGENTK